MRNVTVAATQMACSWDLEANLDRAEALVRQAAEKGANIILLQELFETPYFCQQQKFEYMDLAVPMEECPAVKRFQKVAEELDVVLIPYELEEGMEETKQIIAEIRPGQSVGIFIGPEGGFEKEEVEQAVKAGAEPLTLGKRILRTETAGLTMLSVLMFHLEG